MPKRKISIYQIKQRQADNSTPPNFTDADLTDANHVQFDANDENVRVVVVLEGEFARPDKKHEVKLTLSLTRNDPTGAAVQARKRHRKGKKLQTEKKKIPVGPMTNPPTNNEINRRTITLDKALFADDPDTVFVIQVTSEDGLAMCTRNVYTA